ncbi:MAG: TonB-dependent receptor [Opitutaceae bacterium]
MKPTPRTPIDRVRHHLAIGLAALLTATAAQGQTAAADSVRRLQEENAALRKRLAEMEGKAAPAAPAATAARPAAASPTGPTVSGERLTNETPESGVVALSPFEVTSDKDYGYLKTNAATATRIGMEIQKVPLNISVMSREFLDDTNSRSLMDLFRYSASTSGDTRFAMRRPANEATPQGTFTMRGFSVNTLMRNGVFRYVAYNLDNVERVEIVKGPAAVFFGQGYPGGVINYVTKQPSFSDIGTSFRIQINDNSGQKVTFDDNHVLSKKAAFRIVGAWEDTQGERRFEFRKNFNITPSISFIPFEDGKLRMNLELEYLKEKFSQNDYDWIYSDFAGWKTAALATTAYVANSIKTPSLAYATYINNIRTATGNFSLPAYTKVERGAYYTNAAGQFVKDEAFNYTSRGAYTDNEVKAVTASMDYSPTDWLDIRYVFVKDSSRYNSVEGLTTPWGDGIHWNVAGSSTAGYYRETNTNYVDLVFKKDLFGVKNKILTGYNRASWVQQYNANDPLLTPYYGHVPGATNPIANPGYVAGTSGGSQVPALLAGSGGQIPVNQVIRDRNGVIKLVRAVYTDWDPGFETNPDINVLFPIDRVLLDGYKPELSAAYLNYQGSLLNDRLNVIGGYRREWRKEEGQFLIANFPWFIPPPNAGENQTAYPMDVYSYDYNYAKTNFLDQKGDSWMGGASFAVTKNVNVYASISKTFKFNTGNAGGFFPGDELSVYQSALDYAKSQGKTGFDYLGQTITSVAQAVQVMTARGAYEQVKNETGMNWEFGAKITTDDNKVVGTLSFFRGERTNQRLDDGARQSNLEEPFNSSTTLFAPGTKGYNTRNFRWRTTQLKNRIEGTEAEVIWTPIRNFQAVINGSWLWTAKTVYDKTRNAPGSTAYNASTAAAKVASDIYYNARIENVPEYRFNFFGKYTITDGMARGASIGGGMRYSSETVVSRSVDWNPLAGGYQAGDYTVFDLTVGYPWEVFGYKMQSSFGVYNVFDKEYSEGSFAMSPGRNWLFSSTLRF